MLLFAIFLYYSNIATESAGTQNRTVDTRIFSPVLYQLSYPGFYYNFKKFLAGVNPNRHFFVTSATGQQCQPVARADRKPAGCRQAGDKGLNLKVEGQHQREFPE